MQDFIYPSSNSLNLTIIGSICKEARFYTTNTTRDIWLYSIDTTSDAKLGDVGTTSNFDDDDGNLSDKHEQCGQRNSLVS
jgi:hypothetical protein